MLALLFVCRPQPVQHIRTALPVDAADMVEARKVVSHELRSVTKVRRHGSLSMINDLEHKAWCHRYELMLDGLSPLPRARKQAERAPSLHDDVVDQLDDADFAELIHRERIDDIHDRQVAAAGMEAFAAALRIARAEHRIPNPPASSTVPLSLLSQPRPGATAFA
jgi:hypothetical protein